MTVQLKVLARLGDGWPVWCSSDDDPAGTRSVIHSWEDLQHIVLEHDSSYLDLTFGTDALTELVAALGPPPWTPIGGLGLTDGDGRTP